jgi:hypothetical protein
MGALDWVLGFPKTIPPLSNISSFAHAMKDKTLTTHTSGHLSGWQWLL